MKQDKHRNSAFWRTVVVIGILFAAASNHPVYAEWEWRSLASMSAERSGHTAAAFSHKIYVFGGIRRNMRQENLRSAEVYYPQYDRWEDIEPLPIALYQASAVSIGEFIYIFGGLCNERMNNQIMRYEPSKNEYIIIGEMPVPRRAMGAVNFGRYVMLAGGLAQRMEYPRNGLLWDARENRWTETPPLNQPSSGAGVVNNGIVWIVGGMYFGPLDRIEIFDEGRWRLLERARMPEPCGEMGAVFLNDSTLVIAGGTTLRVGISNTVRYMNTRTLQWSNLPAMRQARTSFPLVRLDGRLYAVGGGISMQQMGEATAEVEVLVQTDAVWDNPPSDKLPTDTKVVLYPNPVVGKAAFLLPGTASQITIFDANGRVLLHEVVNSQNSLWNMPSGLLINGNFYYILTLNDGRWLNGRFTVLR